MCRSIQSFRASSGKRTRGPRRRWGSPPPRAIARTVAAVVRNTWAASSAVSRRGTPSGGTRAPLIEETPHLRRGPTLLQGREQDQSVSTAPPRWRRPAPRRAASPSRPADPGRSCEEAGHDAGAGARGAVAARRRWRQRLGAHAPRTDGDVVRRGSRSWAGCGRASASSCGRPPRGVGVGPGPTGPNSESCAGEEDRMARARALGGMGTGVRSSQVAAGVKAFAGARGGVSVPRLPRPRRSGPCTRHTGVTGLRLAPPVEPCPTGSRVGELVGPTPRRQRLPAGGTGTRGHGWHVPARSATVKPNRTKAARNASTS